MLLPLFIHLLFHLTTTLQPLRLSLSVWFVELGMRGQSVMLCLKM